MSPQLGIRSSTILLLALLVAGLALGVVLADDFGQSWDDPTNADYGEDVLRAYRGSPAFWRHRNLPYYGPAHFAASAILVSVAQWSGSGWHEVDLRHLANFLAFLLGLAGFYLLARRFFDWPIALLGTLLVASQPMQFGHAFINQKDGPFSALFVLTVAVGFRAVGAAEGETDSERRSGRLKESLAIFRSAWNNAPVAARILLSVAIGLSLLAVFDALGQFLLLPSLGEMVAQAYRQEAVAPFQALFDLVATDAYKTPLNLYQQRAAQVYAWASVLLAAGLLLPVGLVLRKWFTPAWAQLGLRREGGLGLWLAAGILLGLLTSIRVAGPLAGVLVTGFYLQRRRLRRPGVLVLFWLVAGVVCYLSWPTLWGAPLSRLLESLSLMGTYERHEVLYQGVAYASTELPWHYVPNLLAIKHTLPAVALALFGLGLLVAGLFSTERRSRLLKAAPWLALWVGIPLAAVILWRGSLYGNVRHLLFITPPLFLLACRGLQWLARLAKSFSIPTGVLALALIPGLVAIVRLHPYEYTYYNSLVGGVGAANGRYELDYWCTAYREAMDFVNETAPAGARVVAWGPERVARSFARPDLEVLPTSANEPSPDYILTCDRALLENWFFSDVPVEHVVARGEAVYAKVKVNVD